MCEIYIICVLYIDDILNNHLNNRNHFLII